MTENVDNFDLYYNEITDEVIIHWRDERLTGQMCLPVEQARRFNIKLASELGKATGRVED